ncbi:MAG: radical SAM/SPASM domain-containing protein [Bacteroidales bacterium]
MKARFSDITNFLSKLTFSKIINAVLIYKSYYFSIILRKPIHCGMPLSASIEATTNCNLRCPECPSGLRQFSRPTGTLDLQGFQKYVNQLERHLMYLMIYFQGEPYMNKDFFEFVKYARSKKIYTSTSTNGHFLDNENARQTVISGPDRMIISLDGTDQETYSSYRIGGDFEKVISGIKNVVAWKKKLKAKKPYIILQFLVLKTNEHRIAEIQELSKDLGVDELQLKSAQFCDFKNGNALMPDNATYSRYLKNADGTYSLKKEIKNSCLRMWQSIVITWDGKIIPCCFDKDAHHQLGNLNTSSLKEIWKSNEYKALRKQILRNRKSIAICNNCTE